MFRVSRGLSRFNGLSRRPALTFAPRPQAILLRQSRQPASPASPASIIQRATFASKKDDRADPPPPKQPIDYEAERRYGERMLEARPSEVSSKSTMPNELKTPTENKADDPILGNELKHDILKGIIKDTFSLENVPRESRILGLAGTVPYFATSLSTIFLVWDLKQDIPSGNAFYDAIIIDHSTAQYLLSVIEPVQLGYGAVIISFLGAIHWGLEYAEKAPSLERTRFRYGMGLAASIVAWPTLLMSVPYALTTQFLAFVGLYFADARATTRGWAPSWYGSYRFALTAMVGLAIFVALIGRQELSQGNTLSQEGLRKRIEQTGRADHETDWAKLEEEEIKKNRKKREEKEKKEKEEAAKKEKEEKKKGKKGKKDDSDKKKDDDGKEAKNEGDEDKEAKNEGDEDKEDNDDGDEGKEDDGESTEESNDEESEGDAKNEEEDEGDSEGKDENEGESEDKDEDSEQDGGEEGNKDDKKQGDKKTKEKKSNDKADDEKAKSDSKEDKDKGSQKSKDKKQADKAGKESESQKGTGK